MESSTAIKKYGYVVSLGRDVEQYTVYFVHIKCTRTKSGERV